MLVPSRRRRQRRTRHSSEDNSLSSSMASEAAAPSPPKGQEEEEEEHAAAADDGSTAPNAPNLDASPFNLLAASGGTGQVAPSAGTFPDSSPAGPQLQVAAAAAEPPNGNQQPFPWSVVFGDSGVAGLRTSRGNRYLPLNKYCCPAVLPHRYVLLLFTQIRTNVFMPLSIFRYLPPRAQHQQQQPLLVAEPHRHQPAALQQQQLPDGPPPVEALRARDSSGGGRRGRLDSLAVDRLAWRGLLSEAASRRNAAAAAASGGGRSSGGGSMAASTTGAASAAATSSAAPSGSGGAPVSATAAPGPAVSDAGAQAAPQLSPRAGRAATEGGGKPPVHSLQQHRQSVRPWMALSMCVRWVWKLLSVICTAVLPHKYVPLSFTQRRSNVLMSMGRMNAPLQFSFLPVWPAACRDQPMSVAFDPSSGGAPMAFDPASGSSPSRTVSEPGPQPQPDTASLGGAEIRDAAAASGAAASGTPLLSGGDDAAEGSHRASPPRFPSLAQWRTTANTSDSCVAATASATEPEPMAAPPTAHPPSPVAAATAWTAVAAQPPSPASVYAALTAAAARCLDGGAAVLQGGMITLTFDDLVRLVQVRPGLCVIVRT